MIVTEGVRGQEDGEVETRTVEESSVMTITTAHVKTGTITQDSVEFVKEVSMSRIGTETMTGQGKEKAATTDTIKRRTRIEI